MTDFPRVLLAANFEPGALGVSYAAAFRRIGCSVQCVEIDDPLLPRMPYTIASRAAHRLTKPVAMVLANLVLLRKGALFDPDLVLILKGNFIAPSTVSRLRRDSHAVLANFNPDSPFNPGVSSRWVVEAIPSYDLHLTWSRGLMPKVETAGAAAVRFLPFARDPDSFRPISTSESAYKAGIVFVGTASPEREEWVSALTDFDLAVWGHRWHRWASRQNHRAFWRGRAAVGADFCKATHGAAICLNLLRPQNAGEHNMRTFEIPACRGFMLTQRSRGQAEFFEEGVSMACFGDASEMREQVGRYLLDSRARQRIAEAGHEVVRPHTYDARALEVISEVKRMRSQVDV